MTNKQTGQFYIGCTTKSPHIRFKRHLKYPSNKKIMDDIYKFGPDIFKIEELCKEENRLKLTQIERRLIKKLKPFYNIIHNSTFQHDGFKLTKKDTYHFDRSIPFSLKINLGPEFKV